MSNLTSRVIKGSALLALARMLSNLLGWVGTIMLARLLTPEDYGLVAIALMIQAVVTAVTEMSLSEALIHHPAPQPDHFHSAWTLSLLRGVGLASLLALSAYPVALLYEDPRLELVMYVNALGTLLMSLSNPRLMLLQKDLNFKFDFVSGLATRFVAVLLSVIVALIYRNYWALIVGAIAANAVNLIVSYTVMPYRPQFRLNKIRDLWSFSVWLTLGQVINTINWRFDQLLVGKLLGKAELGYYSVGDNLAQMPTREAVTPLRKTLFPAFRHIAGDGERLRGSYQRVQSLMSIVALPIGVGFALIAEPFVHAAMGAKWLPAVPVIQALSAVFAFQTLGSIVQPLAMSVGATQSLFWRDVLVFFMRLPIILIGLFFGGLPGLLFARVISGVVGTFMNMDLVRRLSGLSLGQQMQVNHRTLAAIVVMVSGVMLLQYALPAHQPDELHLIGEVLLTAAVGSILYVGAIWLFWRIRGYPDGAEREIARMAGQFIAHRRSRQLADPQ